MTTLTAAPLTGEFIISEANGTRSREVVTVAAAAAALPAGTVLGKITASGKYVAYSDAASDGTETAAGVLYAANAASLGAHAEHGVIEAIRAYPQAQRRYRRADVEAIVEGAAS